MFTSMTLREQPMDQPQQLPPGVSMKGIEFLANGLLLIGSKGESFRFSATARGALEEGRRYATQPEVAFDRFRVADLSRFQPHDGFAELLKALNGLITNDKCCMTRTRRLVLNGGRRPKRLREPASEERNYLQGESAHRGGAYEASMVCAPTAGSLARGSASVGSSLPAPAAMDPGERVGGEL